jgi:hypothetical protein
MKKMSLMKTNMIGVEYHHIYKFYLHIIININININIINV